MQTLEEKGRRKETDKYEKRIAPLVQGLQWATLSKKMTLTRLCAKDKIGNP